MAEGERAKVKLDEFIAKVVADPKSPRDSLLLTGFLGSASDSKQTRIYWDASLSSYIDVDTADIIHTEPLPEAQSPLGGFYIWMKRSAEVSVASAGGQTTKGKFFEGPLMSAYGGMFGGAAAAAGAAGVTPGAAAVHVTLSVACRTLPVVCRPSVAVACLTPDCSLQCTPGCHFPTVVGPGCVVTLDLPGCPGAVGAAAGAGAAAGPAGIRVTQLCTQPAICTLACPPTPIHPCVSHLGCTAYPVCVHTPLCPVTIAACFLTVECPIASAACPGPPGPGPVEGQAAAAAAAPQAIPSLVCSYGPGCWFSWNACPTFFGCGPHRTPGCPQVQAAPAAGPQIAGSYAPHCWFSWDACPTLFGCGPHHTPGCPQAQAAGPQIAGSYAPHCWFSWNACPTLFGGCGPHHTPGCPQAQAAAAGPQIGGSYAPHCWFSWDACPTLFGCGPHHTPGCPQVQAAAAGPQFAGSYAPGCWFSWNACPTMFGGCGPHHTPACPI